MADYALANAWQEARQRLALLESELDPATQRRLMSAGVGPGWHCLEVGVGGGSIAHWLCRTVGPGGRVLATDIDTRLAAIDAPPGLELLQHDLTRDPLPAAQFGAAGRSAAVGIWSLHRRRVGATTRIIDRKPRRK